MPSIYKLFIEIGRTVTFKAGPLKGKLGVISDIIDVHRVMVQGLDFEVRQAHLTDLELQRPVVNIKRNDSREDILAAVKSQDIVAAFEKTPAHKRAVRSTRRAALTDFDRFVARRLRKQRVNLIRAEYKGLAETLKAPEVAAKKEAEKKARIAKYNTKQSYKNLTKKILKKSKARKGAEAYLQKKKEEAKAAKAN
ncbi:ribosomal protein L14 [Acrasis kona]|uniref:Ribosomal protein L14 n=1 Tax=Acrasis kona TaxID=1008807 RepID=A0AAW2ZE04_9EUKA